jgi:hypothetical protein
LKRLTSLTGVLAIALLSACAQNDRPDTASKNAPKAAPQAYSRNPFPSTYRTYPGVVTAITGATIYDGEGGRIENGTIVLANGTISAVGGADTAIPDGATRIDAGGRWVTPGIIRRSRRIRTATR